MGYITKLNKKNIDFKRIVQLKEYKQIKKILKEAYLSMHVCNNILI